MTEQIEPTTISASDAGSAGDGSGTVQTAKEQASSVGQGAAAAGQHVAATAKDQAENVIAEVGGQAKDLFEQARSELVDQAGAQQQRLAAGLRALGDELHSMSQHSDSPGPAADLAKQASTRSHDVASWLDDREPGQLVTELRHFAQRRPGAFLAMAVGAGMLAGRLTRGVKDAAADSDSVATEADSATVGYSTADPLADVEPEVYPDALAESDPYGTEYRLPGGSMRGTAGS